MNFEIAYWLWIVLGIALMLGEIFVGTFFIFWFGAAAVIVGLIVLLIPTLALPVQLIGWGVLSTAFAWAWFKFLKPLSLDKTKAGLSREAMLGQIGQVLSPPTPNGERRGTLRFPAPILGSDEWVFISEDVLKPGDRVSVTDVSGNSLIVSRAGG